MNENLTNCETSLESFNFVKAGIIFLIICLIVPIFFMKGDKNNKRIVMYGIVITAQEVYVGPNYVEFESYGIKGRLEGKDIKIY